MEIRITSAKYCVVMSYIHSWECVGMFLNRRKLHFCNVLRKIPIPPSLEQLVILAFCSTLWRRGTIGLSCCPNTLARNLFPFALYSLIWYSRPTDGHVAHRHSACSTDGGRRRPRLGAFLPILVNLLLSSSSRRKGQYKRVNLHLFFLLWLNHTWDNYKRGV